LQKYKGKDGGFFAVRVSLSRSKATGNDRDGSIVVGVLHIRLALVDFFELDFSFSFGAIKNSDNKKLSDNRKIADNFYNAFYSF
jgi:hypothetical protein